jgi:hypothetical protein
MKSKQKQDRHSPIKGNILFDKLSEWLEGLRDLGGSFEVYAKDPNYKITGRRANRIALKLLDPEKYYTDSHGSVRHIAIA